MSRCGGHPGQSFSTAGVDFIRPRKRVDHPVEKKDQSRHGTDEKHDKSFLVLNSGFGRRYGLEDDLERLEAEDRYDYVKNQKNDSLHRLPGIELAEPGDETREYEGDDRAFLFYGGGFGHAIIYQDLWATEKVGMIISP